MTVMCIRWINDIGSDSSGLQTKYDSGGLQMKNDSCGLRTENDGGGLRPIKTV